MLENPTSAAADPASVVKRYAPPNQRNRPLNRRKSAERFDRTNNLHGNDLEKNQIASSRGWAATMHCFNDSSIDLSERPVMYSGSGAAWGHFRLPHQLMAPAGGAGSPVSSMDFLSELCRLKHNSNVSSGI
ncbi:uncharacterized protein LOC133746486 isoform X2 [Rosa rugosa]|uniref:uncharacterized protein LOC133746486 isoform X2 n=1 Tax=Rosa rugosa TaxID=74645 RepID=UPI002B4047F6|nr:uncharacterized protein LOC133746486 isoform X2 [Rosa rugosa]